HEIYFELVLMGKWIVVRLQCPPCRTMQLNDNCCLGEAKTLRLRNLRKITQSPVVMEVNEIVRYLEVNQMSEQSIGPPLAGKGRPHASINLRINNGYAAVTIIGDESIGHLRRRLSRQIDQIDDVSCTPQRQRQFVECSTDPARPSAK